MKVALAAFSGLVLFCGVAEAQTSETVIKRTTVTETIRKVPQVRQSAPVDDDIITGVIPQPRRSDEGIRVLTPEGTARLGVSCSLWIKDLGTFNSRCDVGRLRDHPTTIVQVGSTRLRIDRSGMDDMEADMYYYDRGGGEWQRIGVAVAQGACWTGARVRFCAQ